MEIEFTQKLELEIVNVGTITDIENKVSLELEIPAPTGGGDEVYFNLNAF